MSKENLSSNIIDVDFEIPDHSHRPGFGRLSQLEAEYKSAYLDELWASIKLEIDADQLNTAHHYLNAPIVMALRLMQRSHEISANRKYQELITIRQAKLGIIDHDSKMAEMYFLGRLAHHSDLNLHEDASDSQSINESNELDLDAYMSLGGNSDVIQEFYDMSGFENGDPQ